MSTSPRRTGTPRPSGVRPPEGKSGNAYCPDAGDFIWISLNPTHGREQQGRRPAIVISPRSYNSRVGLCVACPVTSRAKGYPFEVAVPDSRAITGVILADQVRSLSWEARNAEYIATATASVLDETREKIAVLIGID